MAHALFSPSAAHRWMNCPASWRKEQDFPDESSPFAEEGTVAHYVAQLALEDVAEPEDLIGQELQPEHVSAPVLVTAELAAYVRQYVDFCQDLAAQADWSEVEARSAFPGTEPELAECWGTSDFVCRIGDTLHVVDLKYGRGVVVDAAGNEQLTIYGAAQLLAREAAGEAGIRSVRMTIVQPRVTSGPEWPSAELVREDVVAWVEERLKPAIAACKAPNSIFRAGDWCKFCKFRHACKARAEASLELAQAEFAMEPVDSLTPAQTAELLTKAEDLIAWANDAKEHLLQLALKGAQVPGYKVVAKQARRQWLKDTAATIRALRKARPDLKPKEFFTKAFISPAQAEKLVGKGVLTEKLVASVSSGFTLAKESDKRRAVDMLSAKDEFTAISQDNQ